MKIPFSILSFTLSTLACQALIINNYNESQFDRFNSGSFPDTPVENSQLLDGVVSDVNLDFSGVGWPTEHPGTSGFGGIAMISPLHFVASKHYKPIGTVEFLAQDGTIKTYTIDASGYQTLSGSSGSTPDLVIGKLTTPIASTDPITIYPVPSEVSHLDNYLDRGVITYGRGARDSTSGDLSSRVGYNYLEGFLFAGSTSQNTTFTSITLKGTATGQTQAQGGDSGSPTFAVFDGQLTVLGTHFLTGTWDGDSATFDSFLPYSPYMSQIQNIVTADDYSLTYQPWGDDFTVISNTLIVIPEANYFSVLIGLAALLLVIGRAYPRNASGANRCVRNLGMTRS